ncbi:MAG: LruC domain-containing protein [Pseudohongiellaceae bacterium]
MMNEKYIADRWLAFRILIAGALTLATMTVDAASYGAPDSSPLKSDATICMNIGAQASLTSLDDFRLKALTTDGPAGSIYEGEDTFQLDSNSPVRVIIEGDMMSNGEDEINTMYRIDDSRDYFDTASEGVHRSTHTLRAQAQLGRISEQKSGDYSATVLLTVTPQIGGIGGCGEFKSSLNTIDGWSTLAFEDLYPRKGDGDYNDMVVKYHVEENYNPQGELEKVSLKFEPLARGAGYVHSLNLSLDGQLDNSRNVTTVTNEAFEGDALISVTYSKPNESERTVYNLDKSDDISLFNNTVSSLTRFANVYERADWVDPKLTAQVDIIIANPELNLYEDRGTDSLLWYRPFLTVKNTKQDIDLAVINPHDGMIDENGNPFGLMVPVTWEWPLERRSINDAYPYFGEYTDYLNGKIDTLSTEANQWYNYPADASLTINLDR